jgi:SET and MYND domain-containing protein
VTNLVAPPVFSGKSLTGVDKPWDLEVEAENRLAAAMVVYRERKFKNARALLERFLADYNDKLVGLPIFHALDLSAMFETLLLIWTCMTKHIFYYSSN